MIAKIGVVLHLEIGLNLGLGPYHKQDNLMLSPTIYYLFLLAYESALLMSLHY